MADEERWQVILSEQLGVGVDELHRVMLTLDVEGSVPVEKRNFRVGIALSPDRARALAQKLLRKAEAAEASLSRH